ncbi:MAG: hypothetical protein WDZ76_11805 [Pseudohongiellaceae bacterium]
MKMLKPVVRHRGSVIIIVLWTSVLLTILVTTMASKVRLQARTAFHNQVAANDWAAVQAAVNLAEAELMMERMPRPVGEQMEITDDGELRTPAYRFNGQPLSLNYPSREDMQVRIYDHSGKISLHRISRRNMQALIEHRLGENPDPNEVQRLLSAWTDWTDLNDLQGLDGAESQYYQSLDPGYSPRNNLELDSVDEILHIRGFAELFEGVNLDAAFTVYGSQASVNLNLATREAMQLLPGLNDELIETLIAFRETEDIDNRFEVGLVIPTENLVELSRWIGNNTSNVYSIFVYPEITAQSDDEPADEGEPRTDPVTQAYMKIVEVRNINQLPRVLQVNPYGQLPDTAPARVDEYNIVLPN